jgi:hypothetical protein
VGGADVIVERERTYRTHLVAALELDRVFLSSTFIPLLLSWPA